MSPHTFKTPRGLLLGAAIVLTLAAVTFGGVWLHAGKTPGQLSYKIFHKKTLMTVAYKAYGNPTAASGKYWLARMVLTNDGGSPLRDLKVSYRIPNYIDWTTPDSADELLPTQTAVLPIYPRLPASITHTRTRTPSSIEFKIDYTADGKPVEKIEKRDFDFRGVNEIEYTSLPSAEITNWYDMFDSSELCAAYVTSEDPVVKQYFGKCSEVAGGLPTMDKQEDLLKLMQAVYNFELTTGMRYTGDNGVPEQIGDVQTITQNVRLPRDVIFENSGLCIELAMLMASVGQSAGAKAYLALIPGHCYPVLQASDGSIAVIEATGLGVGGKSMTFDEAVKYGMKEFADLSQGKTQGILIDVAAHQSGGIRPPELENIEVTSVAKMLADRATAAKATEQQQPTTQQQQQPQNQQQDAQNNNTDTTNNNNDNNTNVAGTQYYDDTAGSLRIPVPAAFTSKPQVFQAVHQVAPWYVFGVSNDTGDAIDVFDFPSNNPSQCASALRNLGRQFGLNYQWGQPQQAQISGRQATTVPFSVSTRNGNLNGVLVLIQARQGLVGISFAGPQGDSAFAQTAGQLISNIAAN